MSYRRIAIPTKKIRKYRQKHTIKQTALKFGVSNYSVWAALNIPLNKKT